MTFSRIFGAPLSILTAGLIVLSVTLPAPAQTATTDEATERLFEAVRANNFTAVQESVSDGAVVDRPGSWGMTPIDVAIDKGYFDIAHFLVSVRNFTNVETETEGPPGIPSLNAPLASQAAGAASEKTTESGANTYVMRPQDQLLEPASGPNEDAMANSPEWPADKPHPFDPQAPAPGSTRLLVIGEVGPASPALGESGGEGPLGNLKVFGENAASDATDARTVSEGSLLKPVIGATNSSSATSPN